MVKFTITLYYYMYQWCHPFYHVCLSVRVVYSTLLSRVLGLEGEVGDPSDFKMCVTVFHYSNYFISEAGWVC